MFKSFVLIFLQFTLPLKRIERVKRKAQTARGQRYLKASEVDNRLVQDKSRN